MPFADLSVVTTWLINLIKTGVTAQLGAAVTVTSDPPETLTGIITNRLSLYLYHVSEDPAYRNLPGPGDDDSVASIPLSLSCFYILTPYHHAVGASDEALTRQKLLGFAMKTLHDFPIIDVNTKVASQNIKPVGLSDPDAQLQIILRPVTPEEALHYWSGEDQIAARLSAYYEVRVAQLFPEPPALTGPPVLRIGTYPLVLHAPRLEGTHGRVRFQLPAVAGGTAEAYDAQPAQVSHSTAGPPSNPDNRVTIDGANLRGVSQRLVLRTSLWSKVLNGNEGVRVEDAAWAVSIQEDSVQFDVQPTVTHNGVALDVLPGAYTAQVRVVREENVVIGHLEQVVTSSNETGFTIGARILNHSAADANGRVTVVVDPRFDMLDPAIEDTIELVIDGVVYTRVDGNNFTNNPAKGAGHFKLNSHSLVVQTRFDATLKGTYPLVLVVNGASSQPFWMELP